MNVAFPLPEPAAGPAPADPWEPPTRRSLPEVLAERIVEAIRTGVLKPGDRIVESQLARQLGVSRGPLREALKALEANSIVETRQGRGAFVKRVSDDDLAALVILRAGLEGLAARMVAAKLTPEILADLTARVRQMEALAQDGRTAEWRDEDWRFHEALCRFADNPFLLTAWSAIRNRVRLFLHSHPAFLHDAKHVLENHDEMLKALASGDPDRAERAFRTIVVGSARQRFGAQAPGAFAAFIPRDPAAAPSGADRGGPAHARPGSVR